MATYTFTLYPTAVVRGSLVSDSSVEAPLADEWPSKQADPAPDVSLFQTWGSGDGYALPKYNNNGSGFYYSRPILFEFDLHHVPQWVRDAIAADVDGGTLNYVVSDKIHLEYMNEFCDSVAYPVNISGGKPGYYKQLNGTTFSDPCGRPHFETGYPASATIRELVSQLYSASQYIDTLETETLMPFNASDRMRWHFSGAGMSTSTVSTPHEWIRGVKYVITMELDATPPLSEADLTLTGTSTLVGYGGGQLASTLPSSSASGRFGGFAKLTTTAFSLAPLNVLRATGHRSTPHALTHTLSVPTLSAHAGGFAKLTSPAWSLSVGGTFPIVGRASFTIGDSPTFPTYTLTASGLTGSMAQVSLTTTGGYSISAQGGGWLVSGLPGSYVVLSSGKGGALGSATLTLTGSPTLVASGRRENYGGATLTLPTLRTVASGLARLSCGGFSLFALGGPQLSGTSRVTYAINLHTGAITRYTNHDFIKIVRLANRFFGVSSAGIFELGGNTDDGTPIQAEVTMFNTQFKTPQLKRLSDVYVTGRFDGDIEVDVAADENEAYNYVATGDSACPAHTSRVKTGKGLVGTWFSLTLRNTSGGAMTVERIETTPAVSQRRING